MIKDRGLQNHRAVKSVVRLVLQPLPSLPLVSLKIASAAGDFKKWFSLKYIARFGNLRVFNTSCTF